MMNKYQISAEITSIFHLNLQKITMQTKQSDKYTSAVSRASTNWRSARLRKQL